MEKKRQIKILAIITLVLAVTALTLGYAAFSTTLNISSSASVTPTSDDFKMTVYGFKDLESREQFIQNGYIFNENYFDSNTLHGFNSGTNSGIWLNSATIDNVNKKISNISATITDDGVYAPYPLLIRNEGKYAAYLNIDDFTPYETTIAAPITYGTCTAEPGTSQALVNGICDKIYVMEIITLRIDNIEVNIDEGYVMIPPGEYLLFSITITADNFDYPADGPFSVSFPDIKLNFSTTK